MIQAMKRIIAEKLIYENDISDFVSDSHEAELIAMAIRDIPLVVELYSTALEAGEVPDYAIDTLLAAMSYVFQPIDIIPETKFGLIGFTDDCYVLYQTIKNLQLERFLTDLGIDGLQLDNYLKAIEKHLPGAYRDTVFAFPSNILCCSQNPDK